MGNPTDLYLERLRRRLAKRLPATLVDEHVEEISNHLRENISSRMASGENEADASAEALRDMGSDYLVSDGLIRAHSGVASRSVWRLGWTPALLLFVAGALPFTFLSGLQDQFLMDAAVWLPFCFAVWFAVICFHTRRVVLKPVLWVLSAICALSLAQPWFYGPYGTLPSVSARRAETIRQANVMIKLATEELRMVAGDRHTPFPAVLRSGHKYLGPELYVGDTFSRSILSPIGETGTYRGVRLIQQDTEAEARSKWRALDPREVSHIRDELSGSRQMLSTWQKVYPGWVTSAKNVKSVIILFLPVVAIITAINLLALLAAEIRRRMIVAAWSRRTWI